jgi:NADH dehydrogenase
VPPGLGYAAGWVIGKLVGDVMITKEEIAGLNGNLLMTDAPAAGPTKLTEWVAGHAATLGLRYISELARRLDRREAYQTN